MTVANPPLGNSLRARVDVARRRSRTTPGHLQMLVTAFAVASGALFVIGAGTLVVAQRSVAGMRHATVPAIVGAQHIHATLADADRAEANAFLSGATEAAAPHHQYELDIQDAMRQLEQAAQQAGGDSTVVSQIQAISVQLTEYTTLVDTARADNEQGFPVGAAYLRQASEMMHQPGDGILAKVDQLGDLDAQDLSGENTALIVAVGLLVLYAVAAVVMLRMLGHTQGFLKQRFRRRRCGPLVLAGFLLAMVVGSTAVGAAVTGYQLNTAEGQDYGRLLNLWHIRSLVYDANGDESLSLIARGNGDAFDRSFKSTTRLLFDRPVTDVLVNDAANGDVRFGGLLADELNSSVGSERAAAMDVLRAYRVFMGVDVTMRARSQQGDHDSASLLALGSQLGQLGSAFASLDAALGRCIASIQDQFDFNMAVTEYTLLGAIVFQLLALAIVWSVYRGLRPRMDEYL
jgi:O-acetyl-ADP-ribose deacetylase (regulator of RNase III)